MHPVLGKLKTQIQTGIVRFNDRRTQRLIEKHARINSEAFSHLGQTMTVKSAEQHLRLLRQANKLKRKITSLREKNEGRKMDIVFAKVSARANERK
ncbi:MAG: hypothetical protein WCW44_06425 [archaeon]|jgi:CII-binding regulator of phage lambda lysogenization HflD